MYERRDLDPASLAKWVDHLVKGYTSLPAQVRAEFQPLCDGTIGRAIQSLLQAIGGEHEIIKKLKGLTTGEMPSSPDDFHHSR